MSIPVREPLRCMVSKLIDRTYAGMFDEIRRAFNEGRTIYRLASESSTMREHAREGSSLAKSLASRGELLTKAEKQEKTVAKASRSYKWSLS